MGKESSAGNSGYGGVALCASTKTWVGQLAQRRVKSIMRQVIDENAKHWRHVETWVQGIDRGTVANLTLVLVRFLRPLTE